MSFILEALRRAKRDQQSGINPDLQSVVELPPAPPARPRSPWLTATAIVALGASAAGLMLWSRGERQTSPPVATEVRPAPPAPPPVVPVVPPTLPVAPADAPVTRVRVPQRLGTRPETATPAAREPARTPATASIDGDLAAAVLRRQSQATSTQGTPKRDAGDPPSPSIPVAPSQAAVARPAPAEARKELPPLALRTPVPAPDTSLEKMSVSPPTPAIATASPPPSDEAASGTPRLATQVAPATTDPLPPTTGDVPLAESLPLDQRQLFDGIQLDAHVYADDPVERFVLINMRGHRAGDKVNAAGLVLEAITRDGAILRSGSVRALIPHP